jgi:hypothetical protein
MGSDQYSISGESGIRTHGTLTDTLPFQGSQFNHSCISPRLLEQNVDSVQRTNLRCQYAKCLSNNPLCMMAEEEGFEPSMARRPFRFSRPADSTTLAPFRSFLSYNIRKSAESSNCRNPRPFQNVAIHNEVNNLNSNKQRR